VGLSKEKRFVRKKPALAVIYSGKIELNFDNRLYRGRQTSDAIISVQGEEDIVSEVPITTDFGIKLQSK